MAVWLVRGGRHGEFEEHFLTRDRICLTWNELQDEAYDDVESFADVRKVLEQAFPEGSAAKISNHSSQVRNFLLSMKPGDLIAMPLKNKGAIAVGEIASDRKFAAKEKSPLRHFRDVKWLRKDLPRSVFDQELLYSLSVPATIVGVRAEGAEKRVRNLLTGATPDPIEPDPAVDLEQTATDQIGKLILRKFKGHGFEALVEAILKAQGYVVYRSPEGADKGVDLLAAGPPLGFGQPRICVQVKSTNEPVDHPTLSQLIGTMQSVDASHGLLVSWGGFKGSVDKVRATHFFSVRLWDQSDLLRELLTVYDRLEPDVRTEIPLKRIWAIATSEEEE